MGIFDRLRESGLRRRMERNPIPDELWDWAFREHRIFRGMGPENEARLRELSTAFLSLKRFDAVERTEIDDELKLSVAAQACLPLLSLDIAWYRDFTTIFITPDSYAVTQNWTDEAGVVHEYEDEFAGEAFTLGPVALSLPDIDASGWGDGYNTVIHEMAHKLDGLDGAFDGRPPLHEGMDGKLWKKIFAEALEDLRTKLDTAKGGSRSGCNQSCKMRKFTKYNEKKRVFICFSIVF